jgi:hypothetical protein
VKCGSLLRPGGQWLTGALNDGFEPGAFYQEEGTFREV